jgi:hypothetical protein
LPKPGLVVAARRGERSFHNTARKPDKPDKPSSGGAGVSPHTGSEKVDYKHRSRLHIALDELHAATCSPTPYKAGDERHS